MHEGTCEDSRLLRLVAAGDYDAFTDLYAHYERVAYGLALRVIGDRHLAEDAVVEAMVTVWRSAARFDRGRGTARTWILTIVHRRAVDVVRREERRRSDPIEGVEEGSDASAEQAAWLRLERERVQVALRQLPDPQREALELAYYGGFTQSELADRLGQPLGTIKSRMFAGLSRLRELLEEPAPERDEWNRPRFTR